jgi:hypothetical protein
MAWEQQRRQRAATTDETQIIQPDTAVSAGDPTPPTGGPSQTRGTPRWVGWGQQFGWIMAVAIAVIALLFSVLAFAQSGRGRSAGFGGRAGHFAPYGRPGGGFGGGSPGNPGVAVPPHLGSMR